MSAENVNFTRNRARKPANLTLSRSARWYAKRLRKPLRKSSESGVVEALILAESVRLGLKKPEREVVAA